MVKLDNWQTKAEKVVERRIASKQRRQQRDKTRSNKALSQKLFAWIDQNSKRLISQNENNSPLDIHVWTDSEPSSYNAVVEIIDEEATPEKKKGKPRSNSEIALPQSPTSGKKGRSRSNSEIILIQTPTSGGFTGGKKGRARSNSESGSSGRKKGRPRSLSNASDCQEEGEVPVLCCNNFFGSCLNGGKDGRKKGLYDCCPCGEHTQENNRTIFTVLLGGKPSSNKKEAAITLDSSKEAAIANFANDSSLENSSMEKVYHVQVKMTNAESSRVSDTIITTLSQNNCSNGSIVYLVLNGVLVFDRYRDGIVMSDHDESVLLFGDAGSKRRSVSIGEYGDNAGEGGEGDNNDIVLYHQRLVRYIPHQILEYIITFLPDNAVAKLPLVCKSWNSEIGRSSPDLWRHLIDRRGWPKVHGGCSVAVSSNETNACKEAFMSHYLAVRKLNAVLSGLYKLGVGDRCNTTLQSSKADTAILQFKDLAGQVSGRTLVRVWSPSCALIAQSEECTLHLFNATVSSCGTSKRCRQSIRVSVAPFSSSKKRGCNLVAMDLDDQVVGCLYKVGNEMDPETWLGVVQRDDLLCVKGRGSNLSQLDEGSLLSFNLQEKVLNYFFTSDDVEIMGWIYNHVLTEDGTDPSAVDVDIKESIVVCGNGHFIFEAAIIAHLELDEDSIDADNIISSAIVKVFMFSTFVGEITWVGPSGSAHTSVTEFLHPLKSSLVSHRIVDSQISNSPQGTRTAFLSRTSPDIYKIDVDGSGGVSCKTVFRNLIEGYSEENQERKRWNSESEQVAVLTPSEIVVAECYHVGAAGGTESYLRYKTVFSFHPLTDSDKTCMVEQLTVEGNCLGFPFEWLHNDHIVAFSENFGPSSRATDDDDSRSVTALLIHVPSREIVHRTHVGDFHRSHNCCFSMAMRGNTVAVTIDGIGMFLAGPDVASSCQGSWEKRVREEKCRADKKIRKKNVKQKGGKKDGFARGMRQSQS